MCVTHSILSPSFFPLSLSSTARVQRESLLDREASPAAQRRTGPERGADQDLVPEQAGQAEKVQWHQESAGTAADGAGTLQSFDGAADPRGGGTAGAAGGGGSSDVGRDAVIGQYTHTETQDYDYNNNY